MSGGSDCSARTRKHSTGLRSANGTRLDHRKAQGELLKAAADWNVAGVKLRQAMGLLVRE